MKRKKMLLFSILLAVIVAAVVWIAWGNTALMLHEIRIESENIPNSFSGFRIVQVSDLHNEEFGENNKKLLEQIENADPDMIVITGDIVDSYNTDIEGALSLARQAVLIAPTYFVNGNHEARISEYRALRAGLEEAGVKLLLNASVQLEREGERITLLGIQDPSFRGNTKQGLIRLLPQDDSYTVLLSHRPELFDTYVQSGVDLIFTGHAHGGQFRLPFIGGVFTPGQGFFPKYDAGLYTQGNTNMIVSRGLGNSLFPFRINNRPEIIVVELSGHQ